MANRDDVTAAVSLTGLIINSEYTCMSHVRAVTVTYSSMALVVERSGSYTVKW